MRQRPVVATCAALAMTLVLGASQIAQSAPRSDARAEREKVRAEAAAVAAKINTEKASLAEVDAALQTLSENLATQEAALARTEEEVAQAEQDIADAEAAIAKLTEEADVLRVAMRQRAVNAFVNPPQDSVLSVLDTNDFTTASSRKFYIDLQATSDADIADQLKGTLAEVDFQREKATEAKARAEEKREEQKERVEAVRKAKADQEAVAAKIEANVNANIERSIQLAATDRALSKQIAEEQAALVARLLAEKARKEEQAKATAAALAAQKPKPTAPSGGSSGGSQDNQKPDGGETAPLPPVSGGGGAGTGTGGIPLCWAGGIQVNCAISGQVTNLLNAARAQGVSLSGSGYRDPQRQIELRRAHCGSSYYAIYQMSASSCRPPTARPGSSQHEIGLAIDFSNCSTRGTTCYQWLAGNAASFGFYNLPSEPWHWSTTGS